MYKAKKFEEKKFSDQKIFFKQFALWKMRKRKKRAHDSREQALKVRNMLSVHVSQKMRVKKTTSIQALYNKNLTRMKKRKHSESIAIFKIQPAM